MISNKKGLAIKTLKYSFNDMLPLFLKDKIIEKSLQIIKNSYPQMLSFIKESSLRDKCCFFLEQAELILVGKEIAVSEANSGLTLAKELGRLGATSGLEMEELIKALYTLRHTFWTFIEEDEKLISYLPQEQLLKTVRKANEYLSQINLTIGQEYLTKEREVVMVQKAALEKRQAQIETELKLARKIQQSMFPSRCEYRAFKSCAKIIPSGAVGGDFYDVLPIGDSSNRIDLFIGDVQGKGIPAALVMMMTISILWDTIHQDRTPKEILCEANWRLLAHLSEELTQFVSIFYLSYFPETKKISFAKAGHEEGLLIRKESGKLETLSASGYFLGVFDDAVYEEKEIIVTKGDRLYLYTDGVTALGEQPGIHFDYEDFIALLFLHNHLPISDALDAITSKLQQVNGNQPLKDDVALLVVEF